MGSAIKYDYLIKLLVIGDSGVGKSCMLLRYTDDAFTGPYISTIGIDFKIKATTIENKNVKLQIWDTAGQERFRNITSAYYRGSMGILLVYDVSDEKSFRNVTNWIKQIELNASTDVNTFLVGNKCDVDDESRAVSFEEGKSLAEAYNVGFLETSAKSNTNITQAFEGLGGEVVRRKYPQSVHAVTLMRIGAAHRLVASDNAALERVQSATIKIGGSKGPPRKRSLKECC